MGKVANILIGIQNDYFNGTFFGAKSEGVIEPLNELIESADYSIASLENNSRDDASFKTNGGSWPDHCIKDTKGSEIHPKINTVNISEFIYKSKKRSSKNSSAFDGTNEFGDELDDILVSRGIIEIVIAGLFLEKGILSTVKKALQYGYKVTIYKNTVLALVDKKELLTKLEDLGAEVY